MKRNTKRWLALFLTAALTVNSFLAVCAKDSEEAVGEIQTEEVTVENLETATEEPAIQTEESAVQTEESAVQTEESAVQTEEPVVQTEEDENSARTTVVSGKTSAYADGEYLPTDFTFTGGTGKVTITCEKVVIKDGNITAWIVFSSSKYTTVKVNGTEYASEMIDGKNTFKIPADLNCDMEISALTTAMSEEKWIDYVIHITLPEGSTPITGTDSDPGQNPGEEPGGEEEPKEDQEETPGTQTLSDGIYHVNVISSSSMFKVVQCVLTVENGSMSAAVTLSGTGYDKLYMGTAKEAESAPSEDMIPYFVNSEGKYTYILPVAALDAEIAVAAHSISKDQWYDRTLTFQTEGMTKQELLPGGNKPGSGTSGGSTSGNKPSGSNSSSSVNNGTPDKESKYESDLSGGTGRVNSETGLKDGVYTPDKFSWSGGTGKVTITCNKVTITGGKAYATLVFSSENYQYVKANGNVYYPSSRGNGSTTFVIPVALNKNNQIIGMTTAMSVAHEITYTIFVYLAEAAKADGLNIGSTIVSNEKLDEEAPDILGLEYESETETEYAEYFKIYHYKDGITLLEIDLTKNTIRDPEKETDEKEESEEEDESGLTPAEEAIVQLYHGNVVKYLIVPEDAEIPAGLDKEMIVIEMPADHVYAAAEDSILTMEDMDILDAIAAVAYEKDDCPSESIAEALEKEEIIYGGAFDDPDYKALLKCKCDLSIFPSDLLAKDEDDTDVQEEKTKLLDDIIERHTILEIPMLIDRSADEEEELAQKEWVKVYGVLFGCEEKAAELFDAACKDAK